MILCIKGVINYICFERHMINVDMHDMMYDEICPCG